MRWTSSSRCAGYIDKSGNGVIPFNYEFGVEGEAGLVEPKVIFGDFSEGLTFVMLNKKWGYVDKAGKEVIPFKYDEAHAFSNGLARIRLGNHYGYIGLDGTEYFEP